MLRRRISILSDIQGQTSDYISATSLNTEEVMLLSNSQWQLRSMYSLANTYDATFTGSIKVMMHNGMDTIMELLSAHHQNACYSSCKQMSLLGNQFRKIARMGEKC